MYNKHRRNNSPEGRFISKIFQFARFYSLIPRNLFEQIWETLKLENQAADFPSKNEINLVFDEISQFIFRTGERGYWWEIMADATTWIPCTNNLIENNNGKLKKYRKVHGEMRKIGMAYIFHIIYDSIFI